jgi:hypothetical protein
MRRTHETGWYAEELFSRFALVDVRGDYAGGPVKPVTPTA